jgi:hypothetical protein
MIIKALIVSIYSVFAISIVAIGISSAAPIIGGICNGDTDASSVCTDTNSAPDGGNPISGTNSIFLKTTDIIAYTAGIVAVIVIIVGGFQYVTSGGDSNKAASARSTILGAVIGLFVIVIGKVLINFVISKLK